MRMIGRRVGVYQVEALLGAGGMGEVYRARDTKLGRDVAIKMLSPAVAHDPERLARFEREARVLASLTHQNIGAIYGLEEIADADEQPQHALVLELVEGETLAERLARGPLAVDEVRRVAGQIADALDAAHEKGIVHRDLKPANIKITPDGVVKVLDFGLAKAADRADEASHHTTVLADRTHDGTILGTAAYMSPEQARGRAVDKRTDIWAFGCVVYELLTGAAGFGGATVTDTLVAVLDREPDWSKLPAGTPASMRELLAMCLAKEQKQRLRDIGDAGILLHRRDAGHVADREQLPAPRTAVRAALAVTALLVVAAAVAIGWMLRGPTASGVLSGPVRVALVPPPGAIFSDDVERLSFALSPDGTHLAFVASVQGSTRVWLRPLSAATAVPIEGTEGARSLFWSSDSTAIAFFVDDKLKRISVSGGAPVTICSVPISVGMAGSWSGTDIVYGSVVGDTLYRVSITGGEPVPAVTRDRARGEFRVNWPWFLPDGKRFVFITRLTDGSDHLTVGGDGRPPRRIAALASVVQWIEPEYLVFAREGTLLAQRFDLEAERLVGEPIAVASPVEQFVPTGKASFTASRNGMIAYRSIVNVDRMMWFDRGGRELGAVSAPGAIQSLRISNDGQSVIFDRADARAGGGDLWTFDLRRQTEQRLTSTPTTEVAPIWTADDRAVVFLAAPPPDLFRRDLISGAEVKLTEPGSLRQPLDVSRDGTLAYTQRAGRGNSDVWTLSLSGSPSPSPLLTSQFDETELRFAPDGRVIAWVSDENGRPELYIAPRPLVGAPIPVSREGARHPRWSRGGNELFYLTLDGRVMAVLIHTNPRLSPGTPAELFAMRGKPWRAFDVAPDGRFLAVVPQVLAAEQPLNVILNWTASLPR